jgi:hypothetical protein
MTQIPEFAPRGWREINGNGWLAMVDCDRDRPRDNPGLVGPVKITGKLYECVAVERTLNARPMIHAGETIGLLPKDVGWGPVAAQGPPNMNRKAIILADIRRDHADIVAAIEKCREQTGCLATIIVASGYPRLTGPAEIPDSTWEEWKMKFGTSWSN